MLSGNGHINMKNKHSNALIVFFKWPISGEVKTRLGNKIGYEKAARMYEVFIKECVWRAAQLNGVEIIGFSGNSIPATRCMRCESLQKLFRDLGMQVRTQHGKTLGERMQRAMEEVFQLGYKRVGIIGTDSPDLPNEILSGAFKALAFNGNVCVIGPSQDGGYYFIGMNAMLKEAFEKVTYSSDVTFLETIRQLCKTRCNIYTLPRWYDVDEPEDLERLKQTGTFDWLSFI